MSKQFSPHIYPEWGELIYDLPVEKQAEIFNAILKYPHINPDNGIWRFIKSQIDKDYEVFMERCKKNGDISRSYWSNQTKSNDTERLSTDNQTKSNDTLNINNKHKQETNNNKHKYIFDEFWKNFPKQRAGSKEKAYKSFCKAIDEKKVDANWLIDVTKKYATSDEVKKGFAKGCAAWLNDERYNNEDLNLKKEFDEGRRFMTDEEFDNFWRD